VTPYGRRKDAIEDCGTGKAISPKTGGWAKAIKGAQLMRPEERRESKEGE